MFEIDHTTGDARVTKRGKYFKNVRREWASLVAPTSARFQDAPRLPEVWVIPSSCLWSESFTEVFEVDVAEPLKELMKALLV